LIFSNESGMLGYMKRERVIETVGIIPEVIQNAAQNHSPALLANYTYDLVCEYNSFYQTVPYRFRSGNR
jgi:arginyl-tRNA synthetase